MLLMPVMPDLSCSLLKFVVFRYLVSFQQLNPLLHLNILYSKINLSAKTKIILNLENDEAQRVQHILHLSDAEIMSITRFERGQGLISTNSNHITVSFKASPLEKQLITTDRMELNQILKEKIAQNTHNVVE